MKKNESQLEGVLHHASGKANYVLHRYFPKADLSDFIEQFWIVDWSIQNGHVHSQQNLPDPNFHLVFYHNTAKLIAPVSKVYQYDMQRTGRIIGVKFQLGALAHVLGASANTYIDKQVPGSEIFGAALKNLHCHVCAQTEHEKIVFALEDFLRTLSIPVSPVISTVREQVKLIQNNEQIYNVESLSDSANTSVRTLQRNFARYVGLSPKWIIRKYRLRQALSMLENNTIGMAELVHTLGYSDQAHLIKDFSQILGMTPRQYTQHSQ